MHNAGWGLTTLLAFHHCMGSHKYPSRLRISPGNTTSLDGKRLSLVTWSVCKAGIFPNLSESLSFGLVSERVSER